MDYKEYSIAEISTLKYGKMLPKNKMVSEGFPVYSGYRVTGYTPKYMYEEPMLVVVARGVGGTGDVKISPAKSWITNLSIVLDVDTEKVDKYYLCMLLGMERLKEKLDTGAAQSQITISSLEPYRIRLPSIHNQKLVAGIIRTYDDLIENNTRRIKILEEMAQTIYREWFVNFRFPGHENARFVDSPLGKIPEGWEAKNLFEIAHVTYGFPFKSKQFTTEPKGLPVIRIRDILPNFSETYTEEPAEPKHIVENGDILVGMDGDFHMGKWAGDKAWLNQRVVRFRPKTSLGRYHLFLALEKPIHHFNSTIVGTTVAHLSDEDLRATFLSITPDQLMKLVSETLEPMFDLELNLRLKNANLRRNRDLLLPKLISGEIDVSELDIEIEERDT